MNFGFSVPTFERKPRWDWQFKDNGFMPGIAAEAFKPDFYTGQIVLPKDATDAERDMLLWAYEQAWYHGKDYAERTIRTKVRKFLEIY